MLKKKDLAERIGVSAAAVSQYEKGSTLPTTKVVSALALALGCPTAFFAVDRTLGEAPATRAHFRSLRSTTQQERDRAFSHALLTWDLVRTLQRHVRLPALNIPDDLTIREGDSSSDVEWAAGRARSFFGLGQGPVPNVVRLLEAHGVVCTRLPAQTRRVFAFSCAFPGRPVVILSTERAHRAAGRFDAAHEMGHLLIHHDEEPGSHPIEQQAHLFATEFLAPRDQIADLLPSNANWRRLTELKQTWGLSIQALLYRSRAIGVMTEHTYRRAVTELNARGWRRTEPGDNGDSEQPVLLRRAIDVIEKKGISFDDLAIEARMTSEALRLLVGRGDERPEVLISLSTQ